MKARELEMNDICYYGLWQTVDQVNSTLSTINSDKEKIDALKAQLHFRKNILEQDYRDKKVFNFSSEGKALSLDTLKDSVIKLLDHAANRITPPQESRTPILVGRRVRHRLEADGTPTWYTRKIISQVLYFQSI